MFQRFNLTAKRKRLPAPMPPATLGYRLDGDGAVTQVTVPYAGKADALELPNYTRAAYGLDGSDTNGLAQAYVASVWAFRCIALKANAVARMPWRVVDARTRKEIADHPLAQALRRNPRLFRKWPWSLDIWGETFVEKVRNSFGYPRDLKWLNPMGIDVDTSTGKIRSVQYMPPGGGEYVTFTPDDIVFARTDNPFDDLRGLSPFLTVMDEIGIDRALSRTTRAFFMNDARPGMMFIPKTPIGIAEAQRFIEFWKKEYQGAANAGKPVVMPFEMTLEEVQRPPTSDDVTLRESLRREIAAAFGVPLSLAGAWDEAQYQSLPEQRQSFYEETIMALCMDIADDVNSYALPFFDGSARAEFEWVFDDILALSAATKQKSEALAKDLASGGITVNQYRQEKGYEPLPTGNVLFVPAGVVVTKIDDLGKPAPVAPPPPGGFPFSLPQRPQAPQLPAGASTPPPPAERPALPAPQAIAPQAKATALDELGAWERKALSKGAAKALGFRCDVLSEDVADTVRAALSVASDKAAIRRAFADAKVALKQEPPVDVIEAVATPDEPLDYWRRYDELLQGIGDAWLIDYMARAYEALPESAEALDEPALYAAALDAQHAGLEQAWVGTDDEPGLLTRLVLAGMAAGNEVLLNDARGAPDRVKADPLMALTIDWNLLPKDAIDFARNYFYSLIRGIDETTVAAVQQTIGDWLAAGGTDDELRAALDAIFHDPRRAAVIAQTESTRAYTAGSVERYKRAGIAEIEAFTVRDSRVCPTCAPLHKTRAPIDTGWPGVGRPPFHPGCRCAIRGVI